MPILLFLLFSLAAPIARAECPAEATTATYLTGPYGVGVRTLTLVDRHRSTPAWKTNTRKSTRTLVTEVWYPTDAGSSEPVRDAPLTVGGPFPLVVNSHGYLDNRLGERYYTTLLASRGYIVAAVDFPLTNSGTPGGVYLGDVHNQPGDVSFVIDQLLRLSRRAETEFTGGVDRTKIGVSGLTLGGLTTYLVTYHPRLRDKRIRAALPVAGIACGFTERFYRAADPPLLILHGDQDLLIPYAANAEQGFALSRSPRRLVTLANATHSAFADLVTFPSTTSYDAFLGCPFIADYASHGNISKGAGGKRAGVDASLCPLPCSDPAPANAPMQAVRQHEVTKAVVAAFFDATLKGVTAAQCYLDERLAVENSDVTVASQPGP